MKGIDVAIADPIPLLDEYDVRPSVKDLILENRKMIDEVKQDLQSDPLYVADKHDDLWILRFLLSHKKHTKVALKAARATLLFRKEHNLDEQDIRGESPGKNCKNKATAEYQTHLADDAVCFVVPDAKLGVIGFLHFAGIDQHALVKHVNQSVWFLPSFCYISEFSFRLRHSDDRSIDQICSS
jgi:hypothetical protein